MTMVEGEVQPGPDEVDEEIGPRPGHGIGEVPGISNEVLETGAQEPDDSETE